MATPKQIDKLRTAAQVGVTISGDTLVPGKQQDGTEAFKMKVSELLKTVVDNISFQDINSDIAATIYVIELYASYAYAINHLKIIAGGGTCTAAVKINGTSVTGISAVSVSTSIATGTATAANTVAVGDKITLEITSPTSLNNLQASIKTTRT